ncbi:DNA internalization-related competence protein ComEC/Rec2 [Lottiidibacillus patelloidae]|uniref:DNA internalization-related competence protein ComEC/Rec2 n=1 Tax=Lottiidibacillus patelloidae TaxID=2670334 RepID=A0A263BVP2_9BACI|nr:DNA internalization-related competence protein ComEC/Rec2 [Lottiidibacillus patelloidae]OZM57765.1 DNA internalization-related competence protein ComEC/Rec2 [Lottiidibacillus patelloidae]
MRGKGYLIAITVVVAITAVYYRENILVMLSVLICWLFLIHYKKILLFPLLTLIVFSAYFFYVDTNNTTLLSGDETKFHGEIITSPINKNEKITFTIRNDMNEKLIAKLKDNKSLSIGEKCHIVGTLEKPLTSKNFYDFNYASYLYFQEIHWILHVNEIDCKRKPLSVLEKIKLLRSKGIERVKQSYPKGINGYVNALIFGEKSSIPKDEYQLYQQQGLSHLLAISGLHVGTLFGFIYYIFIRIGLTKEKTRSLLLFILPLYAIIAGSAPSVVRASSMAFFFLLFLRLRKRMLALDAISIACIITLIYDPYKVFHLGFQLSFIVSFFLICSTRIISRYQQRYKQLFVVTIIAQLASFPLVLYTNYEISIWSYFLNLLFIPVYSIVLLPLLFISFFIIEFQAVFHGLISFVEFVFSTLLQLLIMVESFSFGKIIFGKPPIFIVLTYYFTLLVGFYIWEKNEGLKDILKAFTLFMILCIGHWLFPYFDGSIEVTILDVGQGDAIVLKLPYQREVIVIDTGKAIVNKEGEEIYNAGKAVVNPFLKAKGIKRINKLILTHGDIDHIGGATAILNNFPVNKLLLPKTNIKDKISELTKAASKKGIEIIYATRGMRWHVKSGQFVILHPAKQNYYNDSNNQSIVLLSELGNKKWLFTGDIEKEAEEELTKVYKNMDVDVLKVAHHGSNTSSTLKFINETNPHVSVISVGRNNIYGHPHDDVLNRLRRNSGLVARTDRDGAITFIYKRGKWKIIKSLN